MFLFLIADSTLSPFDFLLNIKVGIIVTRLKMPKTVGKRIASVPVSLLCTDFEYQRGTDSKTIHALIREWDITKCSFLLISYRDGKFYVVDGQHRR